MKLFYSLLLVMLSMNNAVSYYESYLGERDGSEPYLSGDTFRRHVDIVFDMKNHTFDPAAVKAGDVIFVATDDGSLEEFLKKYHPLINKKYILVTHNGDMPITEKYREYLDSDKIYVWLAVNVAFIHSKLIPLPIGLENKLWKRNYDDLITMLMGNGANKAQKKYLVRLNFSVRTNPAERQAAFEYFGKQPFCYCAPDTNVHDYLEDICHAKFIVSPHGNGLDCHRTWEALYLGVIPIVKTSSLDAMYDDLPVLIVQNWQDVTQSFLEQKYQEMSMKHYDLEKLYISYWVDYFNRLRMGCRASVQQNKFAYDVDFFSSMQSWASYNLSDAMCDSGTLIVKEMYDCYVVNKPDYSPVPRIPKIIHQIWLGSHLPAKYYALQQSWKNMNPDWQYILWTEKEIEEFSLVNKDKFDSAVNYAIKSDIARYEILYRMGGLYIDTDFECLKPFDLLNHCFDFYVGCVDAIPIALLNSLIGSRPGHPILKRCIEAIQNNKRDFATIDVKEVMEHTGPYMITRSFFSSLQDDIGRTVVFPLTYFFSFPGHLRFEVKDRQEIKKAWVKNESFAVHWWDCSWVK